MLTDIEIDRIIEMAWEDRTPFEAIALQFGLPEAEVFKLMRGQLKCKFSYSLCIRASIRTFHE
jgi:uncharacterized protein (TIGR03643 family)